MRNRLPWLFAAIIFFSCAQKSGEAAIENTAAPATSKQDFFPVTNFIKGEIVDIRSSGINPLKITTAGGKIDSTWLKVEELDQAFADFLHPVIDSATMASFFEETKFLDQTVNAYTFTYEPKTYVPDSLSLQRWDVFIKPQVNTVSRIYIEKTAEQKRQLRLTWRSKESCSIVVLSPQGSVEKEIVIKWKFE